MTLRLAPLLLVCACASTATSVDTFADPADATEGVVAALRSGDPAEANRIFGLYARASVLRDAVFYAVIEAASADYIAGQDESGRRLVEFAHANYPGFASADELEAELRAGLAEGAAVVETAYANAAGALAALSAVQEAIDNEEFPLAAERFDAFLQSWNGEPAELQAEVDRIKLLLPEG